MSVLRSFAAAAALAVPMAACTSVISPDLDSARDRWARTAPSSYSITVTRGCWCHPDAVGPVIITVKNGVVESRVYASTGAPVAQVSAEWFPAVEGLFDVIETATLQRADRLDATYDPVYGHPVRIHIDWKFGWADDEITYTIENFQR